MVYIIVLLLLVDDKDKHIKKDLVVELGKCTNKVNSFVSSEEKANSHEYMRSITNIFSQNVLHSVDKTFQSTKLSRDNKNNILLYGYKDTSVSFMNKTDYKIKFQIMINDGIRNRSK